MKMRRWKKRRKKTSPWEVWTYWVKRLNFATANLPPKTSPPPAGPWNLLHLWIHGTAKSYRLHPRRPLIIFPPCGSAEIRSWGALCALFRGAEIRTTRKTFGICTGGKKIVHHAWTACWRRARILQVAGPPCTYAYTYMCKYIYMYVFSNISTYLYAFVHLCMYVCVYVCVCVYVYMCIYVCV